MKQLTKLTIKTRIGTFSAAYPTEMRRRGPRVCMPTHVKT